MNRLALSIVAPMFAVGALAAQATTHPTRVISTRPTAWADTSGWRLTLERTLQSGDGGAGELANPTSIALVPDGSVFVVDDAPASVKFYDATGRFVRIVGREGSGPGEYRAPMIAVNSTFLAVQDPQQSRATLFRLDGSLVRSFASACCSFGRPISLDAGSRVRVPGFRTVNGVGEDFWVRLDSLGHLLDTLPLPQAMVPLRWKVVVPGGSASYNIPDAPDNVVQPLADGSLVYGRTDRYELIVSRNGRDSVLSFGRSDLRAVAIPRGRRDSAFQAKVARSGPLRGVAKLADMPTVFELWNRIDQDGQRNFWVTREGRLGRPWLFDVFSPSGTLLGSVPRPWASAITSWAGDRVAVLDTDADDLPRIRIFRIVR
jgi:hypothetical protein